METRPGYVTLAKLFRPGHCHCGGVQVCSKVLRSGIMFAELKNQPLVRVVLDDVDRAGGRPLIWVSRCVLDNCGIESLGRPAQTRLRIEIEQKSPRMYFSDAAL